MNRGNQSSVNKSINLPLLVMRSFPHQDPAHINFCSVVCRWLASGQERHAWICRHICYPVQEFFQYSIFLHCGWQCISRSLSWKSIIHISSILHTSTHISLRHHLHSLFVFYRYTVVQRKLVVCSVSFDFISHGHGTQDNHFFHLLSSSSSVNWQYILPV